MQTKVLKPLSKMAAYGGTRYDGNYQLNRWIHVRNLLSEHDLRILGLEADALFSCLGDNQESSCDLVERGCSFDPMEDIVATFPPYHSVRSNLEEYTSMRYRHDGVLGNFSRHDKDFNRMMRTVFFPAATTILGSESVFLFNEHFVIKPAYSPIQFSWHTDENEQLAGLSTLNTKDILEYVSIWVALDDTNSLNGGLVVMDGDDKTKELEVEAGSAILFSSKLLHCSRPNQTAASRRVYYAQFSAHPILGRNSKFPLCFAVRVSPLSEEDDLEVESTGEKKAETLPPYS